MTKAKIILLFVVVITVPTYFILKTKNLDFSLPKLGLNLNMKAENPIQGQIDEVDASGEITITEKELLAIVKPFAKSIDQLDTNITEKNILITGQATTPIKASMHIVVIPEVKDDKITYKIVNMQLGGVTAPTYISNTITNGVNKQLDKNINDELKVKSVKLTDNSLILRVEKR